MPASVCRELDLPPRLTMLPQGLLRLFASLRALPGGGRPLLHALLERAAGDEGEAGTARFLADVFGAPLELVADEDAQVRGLRELVLPWDFSRP